MRTHRVMVSGFVLAFGVVLPLIASAQSVDLTVDAGRALQIALDKKVRLERVGQPVTGVLAEPLYAYDRVVVPSGVVAHGHVAELTPITKKDRAFRYARGDFSPARAVTLQFDSVSLPDGRTMPIDTIVTLGVAAPRLRIAGDGEKRGTAAQVRAAAAEKISEIRRNVGSPGRTARLRDFAIDQLPYHPQYIPRGTLYSAELTRPLNFGSAPGLERAAAGTRLPPNGVLRARLRTSVASGKSQRGSVVRATVTEPLLTAEGWLLIPAGTDLAGEVTFERPARHFRRNGQLRFLFETMHVPEAEPRALAAALYSVETGAADQIVLDQEGGARTTNSKARLIAPAVAVLGAMATFMRDPVETVDEPGAEMSVPGANIGGRAFGGLIGLGAIGAAVAQTSRKVAIVLGGLGVVESVYATFLAKGREVSFPAGTPIQLQLSTTPPTP